MAVLPLKPLAGVAVANREGEKAEAQRQHDDIPHENAPSRVFSENAVSANFRLKAPCVESIAERVLSTFRRRMFDGWEVPPGA
jgi:hypothetical protein